MRHALAAGLLWGLCVVTPAWASGGGGGGGSGGQPAVMQDPDYASGEKAIERKDWATAIRYMEAVTQRDPKNADAWNYQGYAYRQKGDTDTAFQRYEVALRLNPNHKGAHEYLGEAYLMVGNLAKAEEQLKALDKLCWLPCEPYSELKEKIADYKKEHGL
ncbi:tetratricopeptide repeat protein [Chitinimonas sp.]|uniref:tetratricopeptide repeat protein n=1 Tax=Chitinimonas sp. TaxID=1934313 RepID=UPI002F930EE3